MAECTTFKESFFPPKFPSDFIGTWERVDQSEFTNTLTFRPETIRDSNQESYWSTNSQSGDVYSITEWNPYGNKGKISIKLNNGNLDIVANEADFTNKDWQNTKNDWTGTWKMMIEIPEQKFDSPEALKEYLAGPLDNSRTNPIKVAITVNDSMLKNIADVIKSADKYVSLNLTGNALTTIGEGAFKDCKKLRMITIPNSVNNIDVSAFFDCANLTAINVNPNNAIYSSDDGILFNKEQGQPTLLFFPQDHWITEITLSASVGPYAFYGSRITSVTLSGGGVVLSTGNVLTQDTKFLGVVTHRIYENAFINCTSLTRVTINGAVLEKGSFDGNLFDLWNKDSTVNLSDGVTGRDGGYRGTYTRPRPRPNDTSPTWTKGR